MLWVDNIFVSIQGESSYVGFPTVFVRLFGCPVGCAYCDTFQKTRNKMSLGRIVGTVRSYKGIKYVCITGGEPLIQEDTMPLVYELQGLGYNVSIETSGCVPLDEESYRHSYKYVMDIKCPSSEVSHKNVYENLIKLQANDEVKFVISDRQDYEFMKKVLKKYPTQAQILVSPMFGIDMKPVIGKILVDWVIEDNINCRFNFQVHKFMGVE